MIREGAKLSGGEWEVGSWRTIKHSWQPHILPRVEGPQRWAPSSCQSERDAESSLDRTRTRLSPGLLPHPLVTQTLGAALF